MKSVLNYSAIRARAKAKGKRVGKEFFQVLESYVQERVDAACNTHNGGKVTLDATIAGFVGIRPRGSYPQESPTCPK